MLSPRVTRPASVTTTLTILNCHAPLCTKLNLLTNSHCAVRVPLIISVRV